MESLVEKREVSYEASEREGEGEREREREVGLALFVCFM